MTNHTEPPAGPSADELAERRRRFRATIHQINSHQPAKVLRALAADLKSRSGRS